jgi:hypothetical protein
LGLFGLCLNEVIFVAFFTDGMFFVVIFVIYKEFFDF